MTQAYSPVPLSSQAFEQFFVATNLGWSNTKHSK